MIPAIPTLPILPVVNLEDPISKNPKNNHNYYVVIEKVTEEELLSSEKYTILFLLKHLNSVEKDPVPTISLASERVTSKWEELENKLSRELEKDVLSLGDSPFSGSNWTGTTN